MHDEISHLRVVDRFARLRLPGLIGLGVVWVDSHNVELLQVLEGDPIEILELAPENKMQELLAGLACCRLLLCRHDSPNGIGPCARSAA